MESNEMRCHIFQEHLSVLVHWWHRGVRERTVICFDAHLDLQRVSNERVQRLAQCKSVAEFASLGKPHHLIPQLQYCYGIEDFLYVAHRLGIINRIVWVVPPHVPIAGSRVAVDQLAETDGVTLCELQSFSRMDLDSDEPPVTGTMLDVDLTICRHKDLPKLDIDDDALIDFDIDYFVTVPGDRLGTHPRAILQTLSELQLSDSERTITRSVQSGFTPLRYRYLAETLEAYFDDDRQRIHHYDSLLMIDNLIALGDLDQAVEQINLEFERFPECPATHFYLALTAPSEPARQQAIAEAMRNCSDYQPCATRDACGFPARHSEVTIEQATELALRSQFSGGTVVSLDQRQSVQQAITAAAFGLLWNELGMIDRAEHCYRLCVEVFKGHGELGLEIGKSLISLNAADRSKDYLRDAARDDKTTGAANFYLAQAYASQNDIANSIRYAKNAHDLVPAWPAPIRLLASGQSKIEDLEFDVDYNVKLQQACAVIASLANQIG